MSGKQNKRCSACALLRADYPRGCGLFHCPHRNINEELMDIGQHAGRQALGKEKNDG